MAKVLFIDSRDPFGATDPREVPNLVLSVGNEGCDVVPFLVQTAGLSADERAKVGTSTDPDRADAAGDALSPPDPAFDDDDAIWHW